MPANGNLALLDTRLALAQLEIACSGKNGHSVTCREPLDSGAAIVGWLGWSPLGRSAHEHAEGQREEGTVRDQQQHPGGIELVVHRTEHRAR
jgi:hypothetical protein